VIGSPRRLGIRTPGQQLGHRLVDPDFSPPGHLGQERGGEDLRDRADLEHGVPVGRPVVVAGDLPVPEDQ